MITNKISRYNLKAKGIIKQIIIINVIIYIVVNVIASLMFLTNSCSTGGCSSAVMNPLLKFFAMPLPGSVFWSKPWTVFTCMFLHEGFFHILFNMLWFYWMGKILGQHISEKKLLKFYIYGGLSGSILLLVLSGTMGISGAALGASAAVMAIIVGAGVVAPNQYINLFLIGKVKLKWVVITIFLLSCVFDMSSNTGGKIAHLGGAIFGFIYAKYFTTPSFQTMLTAKKKHKNDDDYREYRMNKKEELNFYLDKVSKKGMKSLNEREKKRLKELSGN